VLGAGMHIAMHAMGKITLFFCAGAIMVGSHKTEISEMNGLGRRMPFTFGAFFLGSLSVIGLPPMGGSWSKWYLVLGALDAEQVTMMVVLMVSSLLSIGYLMPVVGNAFFRAPPVEEGDEDGHGQPLDGHRFEAPLLCVLPPVVTGIGCIALFFYAEEIYQLLTGVVTK
jgi:multicomponent Na+:H+ antiporter subunit D